MSYTNREYHELVVAKINEFTEGADNFLELHHPVYHLTIRDLLTTKSFENAKVIGWRAFGTGNEGEKGVHMVRVSDDDDMHYYGGFHSGHVITEQQAVLNENKHNEMLDNLEHALLNINSLKVHAIWFKGKTASAGYLYPLIPRFHNLEPKLYSEPEFVKILLEAAVQTAEFKKPDLNSESLSGG